MVHLTEDDDPASPRGSDDGVHGVDQPGLLDAALLLGRKRGGACPEREALQRLLVGSHLGLHGAQDLPGEVHDFTGFRCPGFPHHPLQEHEGPEGLARLPHPLGILESVHPPRVALRRRLGDGGRAGVCSPGEGGNSGKEQQGDEQGAHDPPCPAARTGKDAQWDAGGWRRRPLWPGRRMPRCC